MQPKPWTFWENAGCLMFIVGFVIISVILLVGPALAGWF